MQTTMSTVEADYVASRPRSKALYEQAAASIAGGIAHDNRRLTPFPPYISHAAGSRKWDVDGHELIDYTMGHGALLLGHAHPAVTAAVAEAAGRGTHFGAGHPLEVRWAELVCRLVPSAERVRFTSSGTEATMMALRLAAISRGRPRYIRFYGHFHGWHDAVAGGYVPPLEAPPPGLPAGVRERAVLLPAEAARVEEALAGDPEIGAIIVEPTGGSYGVAPLPDGFLRDLRHLADRHDAVLIFDEVVTGFRYSPGGMQALSGVTPDLTTLAKILAGGLPGGAVAGRAAIMEHLAFHGDADWDVRRKMHHPGTFNANPLSAAAGVACLEIVSDPRVQQTAADRAALLRDLLRAVFADLDAPCPVYGDSSIVHLLPGVSAPGGPATLPVSVLKGTGAPGLLNRLRLALLLEGVDFFGKSAFVSIMHTEEDIHRTAAAFRRAVARIQADGGWTVP
jgi:glutamate-1-semialdehyde 2,1-aminomutase